MPLHPVWIATNYEDLIDADPRKWTQPTYLYRYYAPDRTLLYIGQTFDFMRRDYQHQRKAWRWDASRAILELFPSTYLAKIAEAHAIHREAPAFNIMADDPGELHIMRDQWFFEEQGRKLEGVRRTVVDIDGEQLSVGKE